MMPMPQPASQSTEQKKKTTLKFHGSELKTLEKWVKSDDGLPDLIRKRVPKMATEGQTSDGQGLRRLRWFVSMNGQRYTVGLNLHNNNRWGSVWILREETARNRALELNAQQHGLSDEMKTIFAAKWSSCPRTDSGQATQGSTST